MTLTDVALGAAVRLAACLGDEMTAAILVRLADRAEKAKAGLEDATATLEIQWHRGEVKRRGVRWNPDERI